VRANDGQICHPYTLWLGLLNNTDTRKHIAIIRELALYELQELHIDVIDDLQVTWEEMGNQWH